MTNMTTAKQEDRHHIEETELDFRRAILRSLTKHHYFSLHIFGQYDPEIEWFEGIAICLVKFVLEFNPGEKQNKQVKFPQALDVK